MAKFYGKIGYANDVEERPGYWTKKFTERTYSGDFLQNSRMLQTSGEVQDNINVANKISIVADQFAYANFHSMQYIEVNGTRWKVSTVEVQHPRLILTIGGVYNGKHGPGRTGTT